MKLFILLQQRIPFPARQTLETTYYAHCNIKLGAMTFAFVLSPTCCPFHGFILLCVSNKIATCEVYQNLKMHYCYMEKYFSYKYTEV